jgi:hypothetical protein
VNRERILLILVGGYVACACMTLSITGVRGGGNRFLIGLAVGSCFAFTIVAATWTVLGPGSRKVRIPLASLLLLAMPTTLFVREGRNEPVSLLLCELAIFAIVVGTGVLLRRLLRVRLRKSTTVQVEIAETSRTSQYGIRHLMFLTTIVAILLAIGRLATPYFIAHSGREFLVFAFLALAVCIICLPIVFSVLALNRIFVPATITMFLAGWATLGEYNLFQSLRMSGPDWIDFVWVNTLTFLPVLLASLGLRLCGYRLVRQLNLTANADTNYILDGSNQHGS